MVLDNNLIKKINDFKKFIVKSIPVVVDNLTTDDSTKSLSAKQGKLLNDNKLNTTHTGYKGKNVVTNATTGVIEFEEKPSIPSASSSTPSADTTNGSYGSGTDYARANHTHPISSIYAPASHTQDLTTINNVSTLTVTITYTDTTTETKNIVIYTGS